MGPDREYPPRRLESGARDAWRVLDSATRSGFAVAASHPPMPIGASTAMPRSRRNSSVAAAPSWPIRRPPVGARMHDFPWRHA